VLTAVKDDGKMIPIKVKRAERAHGFSGAAERVPAASAC